MKDLTRRKTDEEELAERPQDTLSQRIRAAVQRTQGSREESPDGVALLLDVTGSMYGDPIRKLRESARAFPTLRRFEYADDVHELKPGEELREPYGNNKEPLAFTTLKRLGIRRVVMITDGYPDDPQASLDAAKGLRIDIIYIGPPPPPKFLQDLARATGGSYDGSVKFSAEDGSRALTAKIRGLLPSGDTKKPIEL